ncbi:uncharacterized protein A4U43_C01F30320 [Asparagus officinalis]|uniref:Uncharacterized protein n=1 Tax=Asparagus officinalis TaxID=4686 RepID=A0A5P1FX10_ASPOF|nr:uncharacterized protein A4U43_C01F30320 [Asparagus officinalis]
MVRQAGGRPAAVEELECRRSASPNVRARVAFWKAGRLGPCRLYEKEGNMRRKARRNGRMTGGRRIRPARRDRGLRFSSGGERLVTRFPYCGQEGEMWDLFVKNRDYAGQCSG